MITSTEVHELNIQKAANRAVNMMADLGATVADARTQSGFEEAGNGSYDSNDEFTRYEEMGDVVGEYPVRR